MLQAFDDFMSPKVLLISLFSILITISIIFLFLSLAFDYSGEITKLIPTVFNSIVQDVFEKLETYPFLSFILEHKFLMFILHFLVYLGAGVVIYYMFFIIYAFVISFFNIFFIQYIQKKYYTNVELKGINILASVVFYIKTIIIALVLFIVLSPAYLIPAANILIFLPIYYFFHKTIVFDVSSVINTSKEYKKIKRANWSELKARTGFCFMLTLVPFFGILVYPYYVLYLGHYMMQETKELRYVNDFHRK
jgi:hypothetical protein